MKEIYNYIVLILCIIGLSSCNDFLDREPQSSLTPEQYLTTESNIASYVITLYETLDTHGVNQQGYGTFANEVHTDNFAAMSPDKRYVPGQWQVPQTGGSWSFEDIYSCNYFFEKVLPSYEAGKITGNTNNVKHYIGEMYFFRAYAYFKKLQALGDFPIIKKIYPDKMETLTEISKRAPRNEVARFILSDLDKAIEYMGEKSPTGGKNALNKYSAYMLKSRVSLFEGTWLKYFKGTAFVPGGPNWPGESKSYNKGYQYPSGSIDNEIIYFLTEGMDASAIIVDKYPLVENTGLYQENPTDPKNPYFNMFADTDMESYSEIILWRKYNRGLNICNNVASHASRGNNGMGTTKSMVDAFVMLDGTPIYNSTDYKGDKNLKEVLIGRDTRATLFIKTPGRRNLHTAAGSAGEAYEPYPRITDTSNETKYTTGYAICKGLNFDGINTNLIQSEVGSIVFRSAEAYLNYIEACYEKNGNLDSKADQYWRAIRRRAKIEENYNLTVTKTNMNKEAETDWGAYSAGKLIDPLLFNIRRERRCELMAESVRMMDVRRWRSLDQMINNPYHVYGINLWDYMAANWDSFKNIIPGQNVSTPQFSKYLAPYHILPNNIAYNGYRWNMAHYLDPIAIQHILITSKDDNMETSPIYQNPGWSLTAGSGPN